MSTGFWYGGKLVHSGDITAGNMITAFWGVLIAAKSAEDLLPHCVILQKGRASAASLNVVLKKFGGGEEQLQKSDGDSPQFCKGHVELRGVGKPFPSCTASQTNTGLLCLPFPAGHAYTPGLYNFLPCRGDNIRRG